MTNQIKKTQDIIRENGAMLKNIKKQGAITKEQQKNLLEAMKQNANMTEKEAQEYVENFVSQKKKKTQDTIKQTRDGRKQTEGFQQTIKTRKEDIALIKKVAEKMVVSFEEAYNMLHGGDEFKKKVSDKKESKETSTNLPSDVATQEPKAIAYFEQNNEANYLKVVDHVKKLREEGKITYEDLGGGKYAVIMPCGSKKLKMYFPADTKLADTNYDLYDWTGYFKGKAISRNKLWSKDGQNYLKQKEKEGQKLLFEKEFQTLIQSLYPEGTQEEQIGAFMMATGFYGRMVLADRNGDNFQRTVICFRDSANRPLRMRSNGNGGCSLVLSTFVG